MKLWNRLVGFVLVVAMVLFAGAGSAGFAAERDRAGSPVTFTEHIAPIVFENCVSCHRSGEVAPFALISYRDVQKRGKMIVWVTEDRYMPPWHPVDGHGEFQDELRLDADEIDLIGKWVEAGMPEGDQALLPPLPKFSDGWQIGEPDQVVQMSAAYTVPAGGPDIYRNFVVPLNFDEDKWLTAIEVRPSARGVLHHIVFGLDSSGEARRLDEADDEPGFSGMQRRGGAGTGSAGLGGWAVGGTPRKLPMGLATLIPKGADLILRSHFHPSGKEDVEQTVLGLHFTDTPPVRSIIGLQLPPVFGYGAGIDIEPGENHFQIEDSFTLPVDSIGVTVGGHAHYICSEMQMLATFPSGKTESVFLIDQWDFSWQNRYLYKAPIELPAGTRIDARVSYDNSANNPDNPADPPVRVTWGLQSTDEMGSATLLLVSKDEKDSDKLRGAIRAHARQRMAGPSARKSMANSFMARMRMLDTNQDGKIEVADLPERTKAFTVRMDTNKDGVIDEEELTAAGKSYSGSDDSRRSTRRTTRPASGGIRSRGPMVRDVHGWAHYPLDATDAGASVLIFTTVDCPIANSYSPEIRSMISDHAEDPVRFYLVHVDQDVTPETAMRHAEEYDITATVLMDPEHELVRRAGAKFTPEAALYAVDGTLEYRGRIDNWYGGLGKKRPEPTKRDLRDAIRATLDGNEIVNARTEAIGCTIPEAPVR